VRLAAGETFSAAELSNGTVAVWGGNAYGQHGDGLEALSEAPCYGPSESCGAGDGRGVSTVSGLGEVAAIAASGTHMLALTGSGAVEQWGTEPGLHALTPALVSIGKATAVGAAGEHGLVLLEGGGLRSLGSNTDGALGDGRTEAELPASGTPVEVGGLLSAALPAATGTMALAGANPAVLVDASAWHASGALKDSALGQTLSFSGVEFNGHGAEHGQLGGSLSGAFTSHIKLYGVLPLTLGASFTSPTACPKGYICSDAYVEQGLAITSVALLGLVIPTNCHTANVYLAGASPERLTTTSAAASGTVEIPSFRCQGGFLGALFGAVLTAQLSGPGNTLSFGAQA
jgi:hypothetical protein